MNKKKHREIDGFCCLRVVVYTDVFDNFKFACEKGRKNCARKEILKHHMKSHFMVSINMLRIFLPSLQMEKATRIPNTSKVPYKKQQRDQMCS